MNNFMKAFIDASDLLPDNIRSDVAGAVFEPCEVFEIRLIEGSEPLILTDKGKYKGKNLITSEGLQKAMLTLTQNSYHSYQREIAKGFIPLRNGHRAGLAGKIVYDEKGNISAVKSISAIILRISNEVVFKENILVDDFSKEGLYSAIISGPPCSGKTAFLKDTAKKLSDAGYKTAVVDERQELFSHLTGCTVIRGAEKVKGIEMAVRNLSPEILICDEISGQEEAEKLAWTLNCGVAVIASVHAENIETLRKKKIAKCLLETDEFKKMLFLCKYPETGKIREMVEI